MMLGTQYPQTCCWAVPRFCTGECYTSLYLHAKSNGSLLRRLIVKVVEGEDMMETWSLGVPHFMGKQCTSCSEVPILTSAKTRMLMLFGNLGERFSTDIGTAVLSVVES